MENKLPEGWEWKKLGEIFQLSSGKSRPELTNSTPDCDFIYPIYGGNGILGYSREYLIDEPTIIIGRVGQYCGSVYISEQKSWISDNALYAKKFLTDYINLKYLKLALFNLDLNKFQKKCGQPLINQSIVCNQSIPLPPLETQQKIVAILEKAEETKKLRAQADELTQKLLQSVFLEMFGDPTKNSRGWDVRKLGEIITDSMNGLYLPKEKYTSHDGIKMVHMSDAFYGIVELGNLKRVLATKKEIDKYGLTKNDLLVARRSLNFEGAAKASRIPELNEPLIFESSLIKVSPDLKLVTTIYLYHYLNNELVRKTYIYKHITKSTISGINQNSLKNISVILPPIEVQNKFSDFVEQAEKTILNQQQSSLEINNLFDALMQKAFTGKLVS